MKTLCIRTIIILLLGVAVSTGCGVGTVLADTYLGELCWQLDKPATGESWIIKFGVFAKDGNHYYLSGVNAIDGEIVSGSGNAEIYGSNIIITIHASGIHSWGKGSMTTNMTLDLATLNGSWFSLAHEIENDGTHCLEYYEGTATYVSCP